MRIPRLLSWVHDSEERRAFLEASIPTNLMRIELVIFLILASVFINPFQAGAFQTLHTGWGHAPPLLNISLKAADVGMSELVACCLIFLFIALVRRLPVSPGLRRAAVYTYVAFGFLHTDFWFFFVQAPTAIYWCSLVGIAAVLILPPRLSSGLMAANHVLILTVLFVMHPADPLLANIVLGTTLGLAFSIPLSWFIFGKQEKSFQREQTIARQNRDLAQARTDMEEIMAIAAHDLRSPLYGLRDILHIGETLPSLSRDQCNRIFSQGTLACDNLLSLVGRLLEAYTPEYADGIPLDAPQGDVRLSFQSAVERARLLTGNREIEIVLDLSRAGSCQGNPVALGQVLDNLLSNAVRHSPDRGRVTVTLESRPRGWRGEVRDGGNGILEAERGKLFQKFHRGRHPGRGKQGTGLGLFIVRKRMEAMGGKAGYEPGAPKGSVFWVEMPGAPQTG